jgi:uncharacterized protein YyaL (SSP411 family)
MYVKKPVEVIIVKEKNPSTMARWLNQHFLPDGVNAISEVEEIPRLEKYAYFKGRSADGGETAFVCRNFTCSLPIKSETELARQLGISAQPS